MTDTTSKPTFAERMRDTAAEQWGIQQSRDRQVGEIALGRGHVRESITDVIQIVAPEDGKDVTTSGAYVVEITPSRKSDGVTYAAVVDGSRSYRRFRCVEMALLHAISLRAGEGSSEHAAIYAGRVLGVSDTPA